MARGHRVTGGMVIFLKQGRVIALDCINATRDYVQGRALVVEGLSIDPTVLADTSVPLKELARAIAAG